MSISSGRAVDSEQVRMVYIMRITNRSAHWVSGKIATDNFPPPRNRWGWWVKEDVDSWVKRWRRGN